VNNVPLAHQYVLYGAATHETLLELLTHWQPWCPELEWSDMAVHVPVLAAAIADLADRGHIELFYGPPEGEIGLASAADIQRIVNDPANWWCEESTPQTELLLMPSVGLAPIPEPRPDVYRCRRAPDLAGFRPVPTLGLPGLDMPVNNDSLTLAEKELALWRELAAGDPGTYLFHLAASLLTFAELRQALATETVEAITAAREAESMFSELAATMPQRFVDWLLAIQEVRRGLGDPPIA
jgi:hypothetical protein